MEAIHYEILIRRAFKCDRYGHPGADNDIWTSLITAEFNAKIKSGTKKDKYKFLNELETVKSYLGNAFDEVEKELIKNKAEAEKIVEIKSLKILSDRALTTIELSEAIRKGLDRFIEYGIKM